MLKVNPTSLAAQAVNNSLLPPAASNSGAAGASISSKSTTNHLCKNNSTGPGLDDDEAKEMADLLNTIEAGLNSPSSISSAMLESNLGLLAHEKAIKLKVYKNNEIKKETEIKVSDPIKELEDKAYPASNRFSAEVGARIARFFIDSLPDDDVAKSWDIPPILSIEKNSPERKQIVTKTREYFSAENPSGKICEDQMGTRAAIGEYSRDGHELINAVIAKGSAERFPILLEKSEEAIKKAEEQASVLKTAIQGSPLLPEGLQLSRRVALPTDVVSRLESMLGWILADPAFVSTSLDPRGSLEEGVNNKILFEKESGVSLSHVQFQFIVGAGVQGLYIGPGSDSDGGALSRHSEEEEIILPPGRFQILETREVTYDDGHPFGSTDPHTTVHLVTALLLPSYPK